MKYVSINYANYRFYLKVTLLLAQKWFFLFVWIFYLLLWCSLCLLAVFICFHKRTFGRLQKLASTVIRRIPKY